MSDSNFLLSAERNKEIEEKLHSNWQSAFDLKVLAYDLLPSTMDVARSWVKSDNLELDSIRVVYSKQQTAGRGRRGREWKAVHDGMYCTFISASDVDSIKLSGLSLVVGVAIIRVLERIRPGQFKLKWPNDVLSSDGRKLSGTLIEVVRGSDGISHNLLGVGLNIEVGHELNCNACGLKDFGGLEIDSIGICAMLGRELEQVLPTFFRQGFEEFRNEWLSHAMYLNKSVTINSDGDSIEGIFTGIGIDGTVELETKQGSKRISVGDVSAL